MKCTYSNSAYYLVKHIFLRRKWTCWGKTLKSASIVNYIAVKILWPLYILNNIQLESFLDYWILYETWNCFIHKRSYFFSKTNSNRQLLFVIILLFLKLAVFYNVCYFKMNFRKRFFQSFFLCINVQLLFTRNYAENPLF